LIHAHLEVVEKENNKDLVGRPGYNQATVVDVEVVRVDFLAEFECGYEFFGVDGG
jgi:hypothetical protein